MASFSLTKQAKLLKTDDFSSVFNLRKRIANKHLIVRYCPNNLKHARLGLVVSKKNAKSAVKRNYMRRVLLELFRLNQHKLPHVDLIIQVQFLFEKSQFVLIKQEFESLMAKLTIKLSVQQASK